MFSRNRRRSYKTSGSLKFSSGPRRRYQTTEELKKKRWWLKFGAVVILLAIILFYQGARQALKHPLAKPELASCNEVNIPSSIPLSTYHIDSQCNVLSMTIIIPGSKNTRMEMAFNQPKYDERLINANEVLLEISFPPDNMLAHKFVTNFKEDFEVYSHRKQDELYYYEHAWGGWFNRSVNSTANWVSDVI